MASKNEKGGKGKADAQERFSFVRTFADRPVIHIVLILLVGLAAYSNTFKVPFQFDDVYFIEKNPVITSLDNFISSSRGYEYNSQRFMAYLTFALNYHFGEYDVTGYHVVNLAIHATNAVLVYLLILLSFSIRSGQAGQDPHPPGSRPNYSRLIALFSALLFVAHPVQTQAVTYIYQRLTSFATMFYLLSVVSYIMARTAGTAPTGRSKAATAALYVLSVISAVLAMKTKEMTFTLPIIIVFYEIVFFKTDFRKKLLFILPALLTLVIIPISMLGIHKPLGEIISDISEKSRLQTEMPRWDYLMTQMRVITTYIRLIFFPVEQNLDYDYPLSHSFFEPAVLFSFLFLSAVAVLGVYFLRRARRADNAGAVQPFNDDRESAVYYRIAGSGIGWFFITLSVESSVIPIVDVIFEHRVYLPSVGAFAAITTSAFLLVRAAKDNRRTIENGVFAAFSIIVVVLSIAAVSRNSVWGDRLSLWLDVVKKSPAKARGYNDLGNAYNRAGMLDKAEEAYQKTIALDPRNYDAHNDLAIVYAKSNQFDRAIEEFNAAIALNPKYANPHDNLGIIYAGRNQMDRAIDAFSRSIALNPNNSDTYSNRGITYSRINEPRKAFLDFKRACEMGNRRGCENAERMAAAGAGR